MMAEAEALNGIFAPDETTYAWYRAKGMNELPYPPVGPGADATYAVDETFLLPDVVPMIAKPFSPGNAFPAAEVARERLTFDKAMIGSCTNGSYDDLLQAAVVLRAARGGGRVNVARELLRRRQAPDRAARSSARQRIGRRRIPVGWRTHPRLVVRAMLRPRSRRPHGRPARDHDVQSQLAESHGIRRGRLRWTPKFGQVAKVGSRPRRRSLACHERDGVIRLS